MFSRVFNFEFELKLVRINFLELFLKLNSIMKNVIEYSKLLG
jgi:hypothetical protein